MDAAQTEARPPMDPASLLTTGLTTLITEGVSAALRRLTRPEETCQVRAGVIDRALFELMLLDMTEIFA